MEEHKIAIENETLAPSYTVELRVQSLQATSTARAAAIHDANDVLERQRAAFGQTLPDATRSRQLQHRILVEQLARAQQTTYVVCVWGGEGCVGCV